MSCNKTKGFRCIPWSQGIWYSMSDIFCSHSSQKKFFWSVWLHQHMPFTAAGHLKALWRVSHLSRTAEAAKIDFWSWDSKGEPKDAKSEPKGMQSESKGTKSEPKGSQREPNGSKKRAKSNQDGAEKVQKGSPATEPHLNESSFHFCFPFSSWSGFGLRGEAICLHGN